MARRSPTLDFLEALYGSEKLPGSLVIWSRSRRGRKSKTDWTASVDEALNVARPYVQSKDVYYGVALQDSAKALELARKRRPRADLATVRGEERSAVLLPAVWVDLDVAGEGHKAGDLPPNRGAALRLLDAVPLPPSAVVWSGGGFHAYWIFREPWELDTEDERQAAKAVLRRLQAAVRAKAEESGWRVDNTADLARVLRIPGSLNHKGAKAIKSVLEHLGEERYNPGELADVLPEIPTSTSKTAPAGPAPLDPGRRHHTEDRDHGGPPAQLRPIMEGCSWMRRCWTDQAGLPEPEWYAVLGIVGRSVSKRGDGHAMAHEFSRQYPGYSAEETDRKLAHALEASGPRTCQDIAGQLGAKAEHCAKCPHWGQITSPIVLGRGKWKTPKLTEKDVDVVISVREKEVADNVLRRIADQEDNLYRRSGMLVHVVETDAEELREKVFRPIGSPVIRPVVEARVREMSAEHCRFATEHDGKDGTQLQPAHPPVWLARAIQARGQWPGIRTLEGIVEGPTLRPDGSVLQEPGYDRESGLLYRPSITFDPVPNRPNKREIQRALALLREVVCDFPFKAEEHFSAWLSGLLTPLARYTFYGPAPLHLIDGNVRGVGKSLLADACNAIITGRPAARMSYSRDEAEMRKAITAIALGGSSMVLLDNIRGKFGDATLDRMITATTWRDRILGASTEVEIPLSATWFATANNVELAADTPRRVLHIRLESDMERPELRQRFRHPWLLAWIEEERRRLLPAALTLLRGFWTADRPGQTLTGWGSFEAWTDVVRACIVWLDLPDPADTREDLAEIADSEAATTLQLIQGLEEILDDIGYPATVNEILGHLEDAEPIRFEKLRRVFVDLFPKSKGMPSGLHLGRTLRDHRDRYIGGARLTAGRKTNRGVPWNVQRRRSSSDVGDVGDDPQTVRGREQISFLHEREDKKEEAQIVGGRRTSSPTSPTSLDVEKKKEGAANAKRAETSSSASSVTSPPPGWTDDGPVE